MIGFADEDLPIISRREMRKIQMQIKARILIVQRLTEETDPEEWGEMAFLSGAEMAMHTMDGYIDYVLGARHDPMPIEDHTG